MTETYPVSLQKDEEVIAILHRHPATIIMTVAGTIIIAFVILVVLILLSTSNILDFLDWLWNLLIGVVVIGALISVGLDYFRYHNDIWMITNQRIIDAVRRNPFRQEVSTASLANIQDMSISRRGLLATIFKFGDVTCQTASQSHQFIFKGVAEPDKVLDMVDKQHALIRQRESQPTTAQVATAEIVEQEDEQSSE